MRFVVFTLLDGTVKAFNTDYIAYVAVASNGTTLNFTASSGLAPVAISELLDEVMGKLNV